MRVGIPCPTSTIRTKEGPELCPVAMRGMGQCSAGQRRHLGARGYRAVLLHCAPAIWRARRSDYPAMGFRCVTPLNEGRQAALPPRRPDQGHRDGYLAGSGTAPALRSMRPETIPAEWLLVFAMPQAPAAALQPEQIAVFIADTLRPRHADDLRYGADHSRPHPSRRWRGFYPGRAKNAVAGQGFPPCCGTRVTIRARRPAPTGSAPPDLR